MNELGFERRLLEHWTRNVRDSDTVICLGDAAIGRPTGRLIDKLRTDPGRKILVVGNHDGNHLRRLQRAFPVISPAEPRREPTLEARNHA